MPRLSLGLLAALLAIGSASSARAAVPMPPDQVAYSGVLVDGGGAPLAGPVDLTARLYDAASGGTLIFEQSFTNVALEDGHYTLTLGPTGVAIGSPANPLTTSLRTALSGDLAAGAGRFVEITVDTDPPLARVALVLVPYALRADHATTADVATNALDAQALGGVDPIVLEAMFDKWNFDGGPPSSDASEGTADPDGDGQPNFVDSDNDNDGLSDTSEGSFGTNINLVTPRVTSIVPSLASTFAPTPITVQGSGFLPGLTAEFGSQLFSPSVAANSFQVTVAAENAGTSVSLLVTNPNAEAHLLASALAFGAPPPVALPFALASATKPVSIVARGEELLVYGTQQNTNKYAMDTIVDGALAFDVSTYMSGTVPSAYGWSPSRVLFGLRGQSATLQIQLLRDANANNVLSNSELTVLETAATTPKTQSPSIAFDAAGRVGGGYVRSVGGVQNAMAFHDRNGDNAFAGVNELVSIEAVTGASDDLGEAAFDAAGHLAYAYVASGGLRLAWDRSGDGDFDDTVAGVPELSTVTASAGSGCFGLAFDAVGRLAMVNGDNLFRDLSGDGDFADAGETVALVNACDVTAASQGNRIVVARLDGTTLRALVDLTDDGDFADTDEDVQIAIGIAQPIALTETGSGAIRALTPQGVVLGPIR